MNSASKSYLIEFGSAMLAYTLILPISITLIQHYPDSPWRFALALMPVMPLLFALLAMLRFFGRVDELARRIYLDSFAVAAGVTGIGAFAYGMLENVGLPGINLVWVLPCTIAVFGLATAFFSRKYR